MKHTLLYQIALSKIPHVGPVKAKYLVSYCGGVEAVFKEKKHKLLKIPNIGPSLADNIQNPDIFKEAEREINFIEKNGIETVFYLEENYPQRLKQYQESPVILYKKGNFELNHHRTVAIVGTRKPTEYGKINCEKIVEGLFPYNVQIVSGLAYGIDALSHKKSVELGIETVGITGHGLDRIYPAANKQLALKMMEKGGILTEFTSGTTPDRENFPMRNRIIAGMSDVVIVIESKRKGGSIITADFANNYNKDVFAVPGRLQDSASEGCNKLIKQHKANLIESAADIAYIMRWEEMDATKVSQKKLFVELNEKEQQVVDLIRGNNHISIDTLSYEMQVSGSELASLLLNLEFQGVIRALPGKKYILC